MKSGYFHELKVQVTQQQRFCRFTSLGSCSNYFKILGVLFNLLTQSICLVIYALKRFSRDPKFSWICITFCDGNNAKWDSLFLFSSRWQCPLFLCLWLASSRITKKASHISYVVLVLPLNSALNAYDLFTMAID